MCSPRPRSAPSQHQQLGQGGGRRGVPIPKPGQGQLSQPKAIAAELPDHPGPILPTGEACRDAASGFGTTLLLGTRMSGKGEEPECFIKVLHSWNGDLV